MFYNEMSDARWVSSDTSSKIVLCVLFNSFCSLKTLVICQANLSIVMLE